MKRIFSIALLMMAAVGLTVSAKSVRIAPDQVPQAMHEFVQQNFGKGVKIVAADRENEKGGYEYDIILSNACEIEYGVNGEWLEIDAKKGKVPASIVGDEIMQHINVNFPNQTVKKVEKEKYGYQVKLHNGMELMYNQNAQFIGIDD